MFKFESVNQWMKYWTDVENIKSKNQNPTFLNILILTWSNRGKSGQLSKTTKAKSSSDGH